MKNRAEKDKITYNHAESIKKLMEEYKFSAIVHAEEGEISHPLSIIVEYRLPDNMYIHLFICYFFVSGRIRCMVTGKTVTHFHYDIKKDPFTIPKLKRQLFKALI